MRAAQISAAIGAGTISKASRTKSSSSTAIAAGAPCPSATAANPPNCSVWSASQVYTAGDLLTTGTVAGVAASTDDPFANYLKPGDVVEAEIEKLGILRNPVISWREAHGTDAPAADSWV